MLVLIVLVVFPCKILFHKQIVLSRNRPQITTRKPYYTRKTVYKSSGDESEINDDGAAYDENDDDWVPEDDKDEDQPSVNNRPIRPESEIADDSMVSGCLRT